MVRMPKLGGNLMKGNAKYATIGTVAILGLGAAWVLKRMIKEGGSGTGAPLQKTMLTRAMKAYARPALVSEGLGLGSQPGGNWLAVPYRENPLDKYQLNRLPTLASNVVGFPINENNMKFIGGTGFGTCEPGLYALAT